jgi:hypothetical protein
LKNIRRCLKPQKADKAALWATLTASMTAILTATIAAITQGGNAPLLAMIPIAFGIASAAVGILRFQRALEPDEHLKAAQADADNLIAMQAQAQSELDRTLVKALAEAAVAYEQQADEQIQFRTVPRVWVPTDDELFNRNKGNE